MFQLRHQNVHHRDQILLSFIWFKLILADTLCAAGVTSMFISSFGVVLIVVVDTRIKQLVLKLKAVV